MESTPNTKKYLIFCMQSIHIVHRIHGKYSLSEKTGCTFFVCGSRCTCKMCNLWCRQFLPTASSIFATYPLYCFSAFSRNVASGSEGFCKTEEPIPPSPFVLRRRTAPSTTVCSERHLTRSWYSVTSSNSCPHDTSSLSASSNIPFIWSAVSSLLL